MGYYKKEFMKQNIYYTIDEETGAIVLDLYEMEQEALKQFKLMEALMLVVILPQEIYQKIAIVLLFQVLR